MPRTGVKIENFTFNPPELTVKPGTTVTWKNADDIPHSVVEDSRQVPLEGSRYGRKILDDASLMPERSAISADCIRI